MNCPICAHGEFWTIPSIRDTQVERLREQQGDRDDLDWRLCRRCGNAYPSRPPTLAVLQKLWALNRTDADSDPGEREKIWAYRRAIAKAGGERSYRLFAPLARKAKGRFLDIACGLGETVHTFATHGWNAEGIDADPSTVPVHREIGIQARIGQFEELELGTGYDMIHIAHAIYFITDPMRFIRSVRDKLAPDGLFCVVLADLLANSDQGLPGYVHTFFPTRHSMRYALALGGFETVFIKRMSGSIFMAARPAAQPATPFVWPAGILLLYRTKTLRYALIGRPYLLLRRAVKFMIGRR